MSGKDYVGLTTEEALTLAKERGSRFRIGVEDGASSMLTTDFVPGRITATVEDGVVVSYTTENPFAGVSPDLIRKLAQKASKP